MPTAAAQAQAQAQALKLTFAQAQLAAASQAKPKQATKGCLKVELALTLAKEQASHLSRNHALSARPSDSSDTCHLPPASRCRPS